MWGHWYGIRWATRVHTSTKSKIEDSSAKKVLILTAAVGWMDSEGCNIKTLERTFGRITRGK